MCNSVYPNKIATAPHDKLKKNISHSTFTFRVSANQEQHQKKKYIYLLL